MTPNDHYAYVHVLPDAVDASGIFYVGKGCGDRAKAMWSRNSEHQRITKSIGGLGPDIGIMMCSDSDTAFELERGLIKRLQAMDVSLVNRTNGGGRNYNHTAETRARISATQKLLWADRPGTFLGRTHTPETLEKMSRAKRGKVFTDEHRANLSTSHKGKVHAGTFVNGYTHSEDAKRRMSEARKGVPKTGKGLENIRAGCAKRTGIPLSAETRARLSASRMLLPMVTCPHCDKTGRIGGGMSRYHFENCKVRGLV